MSHHRPAAPLEETHAGPRGRPAQPQRGAELGPSVAAAARNESSERSARRLPHADGIRADAQRQIDELRPALDAGPASSWEPHAQRITEEERHTYRGVLRPAVTRTEDEPRIGPPRPAAGAEPGRCSPRCRSRRRRGTRERPHRRRAAKTRLDELDRRSRTLHGQIRKANARSRRSLRAVPARSSVVPSTPSSTGPRAGRSAEGPHRAPHPRTTRPRLPERLDVRSDRPRPVERVARPRSDLAPRTGHRTRPQPGPEGRRAHSGDDLGR